MTIFYHIVLIGFILSLQMVCDMHKRKFNSSHNLASYDYKTGLYHNRSGSFLTLAEANATAWICAKCQAGFASASRLRTHRDAVHSY
jgi:hypothetical protein